MNVNAIESKAMKVRLPHDLHARVLHLMARTGQSPSHIIAQALESYLGGDKQRARCDEPLLLSSLFKN